MTTTSDDTKETGVNKAAGTLLPPAQIHLFSADEETISTFNALAADWRFGRISMSVRGGNLSDAITHYSRRKSPTLILIQTEDTGEAFQAELENLAGVCNEGTAAIVIGPVNDVRLYRHLIGMGISDYLVKPLETEQMVEAIAAALQDIVGAVDSHLMAVMGTKGGVGTTTIGALMAACLGGEYAAKTLLLDASGGSSTLWNHFGFTPSGTLIEAARAIVDKDTDAFDRLIIKKNDSLHIMNSGAESILDNPVATQAFEMLLDKCLSTYPNVVLDLSRAPVQIVRMALARANSIGVVATPRVPDLAIAKLLLKDLQALPGAAGRVPTVFLNKTGQAKGEDIALKDVAEALKTDNMIALPWQASLFAGAENTGEFVGDRPGAQAFRTQICTAAARMTGYARPDDAPGKTGMKGGLFSFLRKGG